MELLPCRLCQDQRNTITVLVYLLNEYRTSNKEFRNIEGNIKQIHCYVLTQCVLQSY